MAKNWIEAMCNYRGYQFESSSEQTAEFKSALKVFKNAMKQIAKENNYELVYSGDTKSAHFCYTAILKNPNNNKFVYVHISDVRDGDYTWDRILCRECANEKDFNGGYNQFTKIEYIQNMINKILN